MPSMLIWIIQLLLIPALSPFFIGVTRKIKARMQNRRGASPFQPYKDLWKLFHKDEVISRDASWIFRFAPYLIFSTTVIIGVSIPLMTLALIEWASANKYLIFIALGANLFFPWGIAGSTDVAEMSLSLALFIGKGLMFCAAVAIIESSMAKFRIFRLPDLLFTSLIIGIIAIGLI